MSMDDNKLKLLCFILQYLYWPRELPRNIFIANEPKIHNFKYARMFLVISKSGNK